MVLETKQVGSEPVYESLDSWSISYDGWNFTPNPRGSVAERTLTKVSCYSWKVQQLRYMLRLRQRNIIHTNCKCCKLSTTGVLNLSPV